MHVCGMQRDVVGFLCRCSAVHVYRMQGEGSIKGQPTGFHETSLSATDRHLGTRAAVSKLPTEANHPVPRIMPHRFSGTASRKGMVSDQESGLGIRSFIKMYSKELAVDVNGYTDSTCSLKMAFWATCLTSQMKRLNSLSVFSPSLLWRAQCLGSPIMHALWHSLTAFHVSFSYTFLFTLIKMSEVHVLCVPYLIAQTL